VDNVDFEILSCFFDLSFISHVVLVSIDSGRIVTKIEVKVIEHVWKELQFYACLSSSENTVIEPKQTRRILDLITLGCSNQGKLLPRDETEVRTKDEMDSQILRVTG
jgi:hypothetical protein